ncbi:MAG TPA: bifunctional diaminohydroxyphosphoribosylaminopyrimidine deaminase/5-amino-6-(5-phosphoribosylamino)uracil reductase RibD [Tepidisphaeraceae bacterium]|jgi:diaminohydroxyphosphoribosylaminopyrimidine deaminase/5-amino-6-(5-phosphoribosylamino)uracil reductase|nr:bifunctional diaminohydroxyphosphoribosylaminopyrimidine deaminase/5-amino-6-(5-phosphoribosylamino)uracil reductase RibD [Tepidisphaeraceae bacterium]
MPTDEASSHKTFMRRALQLAARGRGSVEPNPMVGCVIVRDGRIIGDGYHQQFGGPHAEREALAACRESPRGATVYVNLEPCCHTNKKTPPCVPALIEAGVARVVVGCLDPNPQVSGKGTEAVRAAGIDVKVGVLEPEARQLNAAYFASLISGRPYVTLKWAQSADGKVAGPRGQRKQISNDLSMKVVHELRARSDAILVGIGTVLADDPLLTARTSHQKKRPLIRAVLDSSLRIPLQSRLVKTAAESTVVIYCTTPESTSDKARALQEKGLQVIGIPVGRLGKPAPTFVLADLAKRGVTHLAVDAGPTLGQSLIDQGLADRVWLIQSPIVIGVPDAPSAPVAPYQEVASIDLRGDRLVELLNLFSDAFFAAAPSADMNWAREMVS